MALIQKIEPSLNRMTNEVPGRVRRERGALSDIVVALGQTGEEISAKIKQASLLAEKTRAENQRDSVLRDIEARASADNDISEKNVKKYEAEISKAVSDSASQISIPIFREDYQLESMSKSEIYRTNIRNNFVKKSIDVGKQQLDIFSKNKVDEFIKARSPKEKERAYIEMDRKIEEALQAGYIDPANALKMRAEYPNQWAKAEVEYDIDSAPLLAKEKIIADAYEGLSEEEKMDYLKQSDDAIEKMGEVERKAQYMAKSQKEREIVDLAMRQQLSPEILRENKSALDPQLYDSLVRSMTSPRGVKAKTDNLAYEEVWQDIANRELSATQIRTKIFDLNAQGKLTDENVRHFLFTQMTGQTSTIEQDYLDEVEKSKNPVKQKSWVGGIWDIVKGGYSLHPAVLMGKIIQRSMNENATTQEKMIPIVNEEIRKSRIQDNPWIAQLPEKGKLYTDAFGNKALIYPDGSIEEVQSSGGEYKQKQLRTKE